MSYVDLCHVPCFFLPCHSALCRMLILRNGHVAVSNLRVKSPTSSSGRLMNRISQAPPGEWDLYSQPTGAEPGGRWAGRRGVMGPNVMRWRRQRLFDIIQ